MHSRGITWIRSCRSPKNIPQVRRRGIMPDLVLRFVIIASVGGQLCFAHASSASESKHEMVSIDAKPEPISIDPARSAVIVVDMENDFAAKGGMFDRAGVDISGAQKVIAPTAKVMAAARQAGVKILYFKIGCCPDPFAPRPIYSGQ